MQPVCVWADEEMIINKIDMEEKLLHIVNSVEWDNPSDKSTAQYVARQLGNGLGIDQVAPLELRVLKEAGIYQAFRNITGPNP